MDNQIDSPISQPVVSKKRRWLWVVVSVLCLVVILVAVFYIYLYLSTDITKTGGLETIQGLYKFKCEQTAQHVFERWGSGGQYCFPKSSEAGKTCAHDSDCNGGACRIPSDKIVIGGINGSNSRVTVDTGTCSDADYSSSVWSEGTYKFPGCTIDQGCRLVD
jgi:hypothetical protein